MTYYPSASIQFPDTFARMYPDLVAGMLNVKNVTFIVTEDCNLRCSYCYEHSKDRRNVMKKETARAAVDMLFEADRSGSEYLNDRNATALILEFIGGEPLLEMELINYIIEYFKHKALTLKHRWALFYMISITTNGILFNTPEVRSFLKRNEGRVSFTITIDGNKELHDACRRFPDGKGSYDIVEKAFKRYLDMGFYKGTKLTIAPANVGYLYEACKNLYGLGVDSIFANCVFEKGWEIEHAKVLYQQMKLLADYLLEEDRYAELSNSLFEESIGQPLSEEYNENWCGGTGKMLAIGTDGRVYPCIRYMPYSNRREPIVIGSVHEGIGATAGHAEAIRCLNGITRRSQSTDECYYCPVASGCAWCSAYNYEETGTPDKRVTYICLMHKARVLGNVYFWNKLYRKQGRSARFPMSMPEDWVLEIVGEEETTELKSLADL